MHLTDFSRIDGSCDMNLVKATHVVGVGAGGAFSLYQSLARCGIGRLTVLDFDKVEEVNIVRQGYDSRDIGKLKVEALGDHLRHINEGTAYTGVTKNFLDMSDTELDAIFGEADIFLFLTDSFPAQAFGNKLALRYQRPTIWAGYYAESKCAEIVFTVPNLTEGCFRCAVSSRYSAQASTTGGIVVSSRDNTIFHSGVLDAYVGMLTMAILHNKTKGYQYSNWFGERWNRNLIQIGVHPSRDNPQAQAFDRICEGSPADGLFTFNSLWQIILAEAPHNGFEPCPDCQGTLLTESVLPKLTGSSPV